MKKILYSVIAGLVLASCGSMAPTANNSAATPAPAQTTTTTATPSASQVESSVKDAINNAVATNNSESYLAGQQSGVALKALYAQYKELAEKEANIIFGGRLGEYKYYDMDAVIASALDMAARELA